MIGCLTCASLAFGLQSQVLNHIITFLQAKLNIADPNHPTRQWSLPYLVSSAVTAVSIYCGNFGDAMWKSSPPPPTTQLSFWKMCVGEEGRTKVESYI